MSAHIVGTPHGFRILDRQVSALRLVGGFFLLMGGFVVAASFGIIPSDSHPILFSSDWFGVFAIGTVFAGVGLAAFRYKNYVEFDFSKQELHLIKGLKKLQGERISLNGYKDVLVSREKDTNSESYNDYLYPVLLRGDGVEGVAVGKYDDVGDALEVAQLLAARAGLRAVDSVLGAAQEFSFVPNGKADDFDVQDFRQVYSRKIPFKEDGGRRSLSRFYHARYQGGVFYKVEYAGTLIPNLIGICFSWGAYYYFFQGSLLDIVAEFLAKGEPLKLEGMKAEDFFGTLFSVVFFLFLVVGPLFSLLKKMVKGKPFEFIGVGTKNLVLYSPMAYLKWNIKGLKKGKAIVVAYDDVHDLTVKAVDNPKWKIMKLDNGIGLRVKDKFIEVGRGLDARQLNQIADEIKSHVRP
ncbi:MAG TPA: hypothetical protein PKI93_07250 [Alphaproteobacteria bacterium]|nr:hypothetical protein [Alphaproteobacteria bacterium]HNS43880.1 hypothetical protein [Alphaproteobacteria bacterium]